MPWTYWYTRLFAHTFAGLLAAGLFPTSGMAVEPLLGFGRCGECPGDEQEEAEEEDCYWGPCPCQPRMTLFQWSYGTSFGGGADLDEPLVTDRPDFTESSSTVGRGVAQLEMGYTYVYDAEAGDRTRTHSYPQTLLRYGILAEWLELRVGWNYAEEATRVDGVPARAGGSEDLYLGLKFALTPQECLLTEMALIAQMTVPSGSAAFSAGETLPGVNWIYSWEINDWLSTAGSSQFNRAIDEVTGETYLEYAQSWTFGYSLTERLGAYTEWFALIPSGADTVRTQHYFNGGFTFLLSNDIQYDVFAGVGLNRAADDYFLGTGLSMRF